MPSPRAGTVTPDVARVVKEYKAGKVEFRNDATGIVHAVVGNAHKSRLPILVEELCEQPVQPIVLHSPMEDDVPPVEPHAGRNRPAPRELRRGDHRRATGTACCRPLGPVRDR